MFQSSLHESDDPVQCSAELQTPNSAKASREIGCYIVIQQKPSTSSVYLQLSDSPRRPIIAAEAPTPLHLAARGQWTSANLANWILDVDAFVIGMRLPRCFSNPRHCFIASCALLHRSPSPFAPPRPAGNDWSKKSPNPNRDCVAGRIGETSRPARSCAEYVPSIRALPY